MWKLIYINRFENEVISFTPGTLAACLDMVPTIIQNGTESASIQQSRRLVAEADLKRHGARYHEFPGGTLVLAEVE